MIQPLDALTEALDIKFLPPAPELLASDAILLHKFVERRLGGCPGARGAKHADRASGDALPVVDQLAIRRIKEHQVPPVAGARFQGAIIHEQVRHRRIPGEISSRSFRI